MILHRYVDPNLAIRIWSCDECNRKAYFDNYMVHCFWVEDINLIFLSSCDQNLF